MIFLSYSKQTSGGGVTESTEMFWNDTLAYERLKELQQQSVGEVTVSNQYPSNPRQKSHITPTAGLS